MKKHLATYWILQFTGWGLYCAGYIFLYLTILPWREDYFYAQLATHAISGLLLTHLMRTVIRRSGALDYPFKKQLLTVILLSLCFAFLIGLTAIGLETIMGIQDKRSVKYSFLNIVSRFAISYFQFVFLWNLIYFTYHYMQKNKQQKIDQARLESLLKELEIRTIKAHINPHFIFNALNSIRALVVEDPERARSAITQLSNILRNSMHGDKAEKILFEKELSVARDYLALELIRFEDRLQVSFDIDEDTLDHPVPTMILQAMIENALNYGINRNSSTGSLHVWSNYTNHHHVFGVTSSGSFREYIHERKEGIVKLQGRLDLMYGPDAGFGVIQTREGLIESKISIPI